MTASRTPILPLAFEHLILASFRKIKTNLAAASSPAARQTRPRFGDKADPLSFEDNFERLLFIWIVLTAEVCGDGGPAHRRSRR